MKTKRYSLQRRLLVGSTAVTSLVLVGFGAVVYFSARRHLIAGLDQSLRQRANYISGLAEYDHGGLDQELGKLDLQRMRREGKWGFVIHSPSGAVLGQAGLGRDDVSLPWKNMHSKPARTIDVGEAGRVRVKWLKYTPAWEDERAEGGQTTAGAKVSPRLDVSPGTPLVLTMIHSMDGVERTLADLLALLAVLWLVAVGVLVLVLGWVIRRGMAPAKALAASIDSIDPAKSDQRIELAVIPNELEPVERRLNDLLARTDEAMARERSFLAAAAHELRTPLTGLRTTLDVALMRPREAEHYRRKLDRCLDLTKRLQLLMDNLLTAARLEAGTVEAKREAVELGLAIDACWAPFKGRAQARSLTFEKLMDADAWVWASGPLLEMVLANVLSNAAAYATTGGTVQATSSRGDGTTELTITNPSAGIDQAMVSHVFDRFWRADASRASDAGHLGLGLSICRDLVTRMGGSITAEAEEGWFTIRLTFGEAPNEPTASPGDWQASVEVSAEHPPEQTP